MRQTSRNSRVIKASVQTIYDALTNPRALETWQAPNDMTGKVHHFDLREGGGYTMSLFYADMENGNLGKTATNEDRFTAKFVELKPPRKIVEAIIFDSPDPDFSGEMIMEITIEPEDDGSNVTFSFKDIPVGIKPEDNEAGTISSLEKLARYVE